jgi:hypothetical protein
MSEKKQLNSYDLSRVWFDFCFENPEKIKPIHSAIYFFAIEHCNRLGWKKKFGFPSTMTMDALGVKSYNTYIKALNELVDFGFLEMVQKSKNQYSANIIALSKFNKALDKALDKAFIKHTTKQSESTVQSIVSINKQETINNKQETIDLFERAWKSFGNYGTKKKALEYWMKLKPEDHELIINRIPIYLNHLELSGYSKKMFQGWINPKDRVFETTYENSTPSAPNNKHESEGQMIRSSEPIQTAPRVLNPDGTEGF